MSGRTCPIPGCFETMSATHLMCRKHWRMVDRITQQAIYDAFRTRRGSEEHWGLIRDAIDQVMGAISSGVS